MIKGNKGQLLLYGMIAGLIVAVAIGFVNDLKTKDEFPVIGTSSLELISSSIEAEKALLYIDQSAKYSVSQSIFDTAKTGGCSDSNIFSGHTLWNINNQVSNPSQCDPGGTSAKNMFKDIFTNKLNNFLLKYEDIDIPLNNYNYAFDDSTFMGTATSPIETVVRGKEDSVLSVYSIRPSFKTDLGDYDFEDYGDLANKAKKLIDGCVDQSSSICVGSREYIFDTADFEACGSRFSTFLDFRWVLDINNNLKRYSIYGFCVKSIDNLVYAQDAGETDLRNVEYKFALQLEDVQCDSGNYLNTQCLDIPCSSFYSCRSAEEVCFCDVPGAGSRNACVGDCSPFCSSADPDLVLDIEPPTTLCKQYSCNSYLDCNFATSCGCPDPSVPELSVACQLPPEASADCSTLHCERDNQLEIDRGISTQCLDTNNCNNFGSCSSTSLCGGCISPEIACQGECFCNSQGWQDTGKCDDVRKDGVDCKWYERPQIKEYNPSTCRSTQYRCDPRPESECKAPTPPSCTADGNSDTKCVSVSCANFDFCSGTSSCTCAPGKAACVGACTEPDECGEVGAC